MTFFYIAIGLMAFVVALVLVVALALAVYLTVGFCALIAAITKEIL